ncbi:MAG: hypothetical protein Satyrvirus2_62 [Satyrvirus sp.]|uniref:Core-2/I-Branching enzyme n=1 Tax=Satyrvirus sp. TaxID=2487771 RepID=A0A3G5AFK2_9VIRU|nr:MAG: hypothetical protein Satyrvirus2_62 [Satyrvirus sp.]
MAKKLAFLFLIYDEINHEELWYNFFKNIDKSKYSIYIYYKYQKPLKYFEEYKLCNCIPTIHGTISIVHAHNILIKAALQDLDNYKFINVSQACIPFKSFDYIYDFLTKDNFAHFNVAPQKQCLPRCISVLDNLPHYRIYKSSNWFILNRSLAELVNTNDKFIDYFKDVRNPEQHFFITMVYDYWRHKEIIATDNLAEGATTFTNWQDMNYKYPSQKNLKNYKNISNNELQYLLDAPCLFGRKFDKGCFRKEQLKMFRF